ncbi:hypothetical protein [Nocardia sp. NPDC058497]|uniref:hypothetical protein n=1 Tax=Nocardia sp. NPDC058497 TaxID=3346529 RepID=UPI003661EFC2
MFDPSTIQARLLQAVQNLAADNWRETHRAGDSELPVASRAHIEVGNRAREQLEQVAIAVGIPGSVLAYHRAAGERGQRYRPGQALLSTEQISRDGLLAGYRRLVHDLQDSAGIVAAAGVRDLLDHSTFAAYRQALGVAWQHAGAIAAVLDLAETERATAWTRGTSGWVRAVAQRAAALDQKVLLSRLVHTAAADPSAALVPLAVLGEAGITGSDIIAQMPIGPDDMVEHLTTGIRALPPAPAHGIDAAIAATGIDTQHDPDPAASDPDIGPPPGATPGPDIGQGL